MSWPKGNSPGPVRRGSRAVLGDDQRLGVVARPGKDGLDRLTTAGVDHDRSEQVGRGLLRARMQRQDHEHEHVVRAGGVDSLVNVGAKERLVRGEEHRRPDDDETKAYYVLALQHV